MAHTRYVMMGTWTRQEEVERMLAELVPVGSRALHVDWEDAGCQQAWPDSVVCQPQHEGYPCSPFMRKQIDALQQIAWRNWPESRIRQAIATLLSGKLMSLYKSTAKIFNHRKLLAIHI
jgi:hypothetical protein